MNFRMTRISFGGLLLAMFMVASAASTPKEAGKIVRLKGEVRIDDASGNIVASTKQSGNRRLITEGSVFYVGEVIKTFDDARVKLEMNQGNAAGEKNTVVLGGNTRLAIEDVSQRGDKKVTSLQLYEGEIRNDVHAKYKGKDGDTYEVKTQNAVAGVRGTDFTVTYHDHTMTTALTHGAVNLRQVVNNVVTHTVDVPKGMYAVASASPSAPPAQAISIATNPALAAKIDVLGGDDHKADERLPSSDTKAGEKGDKGSDKNDKAAAKPEAKSDDKPAAPLFREKESTSNDSSSDRSPASVIGAPTTGGSPALQRFAGENGVNTSNSATVNKVLTQIQNTQTTINGATQNNAAATAAKGTVCVSLSGGSCN